MISRKDASCCVGPCSPCCSCFVPARSCPARSTNPLLTQNERHFNFHYSFTVKNVSPGDHVRVWIPLAHSDAFQDVKVTSKSGDLPLKQVRQPEYGNEVLYAETAKADKAEYKFSVDYDVVRKEHVVLVNGKPVERRGLAKLRMSNWRDFLSRIGWCR